jgi:hypothetical protein
MNEIEQPVLRSVNTGSNRYCGPAALSIITGMDTGRCAKFFRKISGKRAIRGLHHHHMLKGLALLGYEAHTCVILPKQNLLQWAKENCMILEPLYLLSVGHHYALVQKDQYCCGIVKNPVKLSESPYARKRVNQVWIIVRKTVVDFDKECPTDAIDPNWASKIAVYRRAKEIGAEVYMDDGQIWLYPPTLVLFEDHDPYEGEHSVCDWKVAGQMLETYSKMMAGMPGEIAREAADRS